MTVKELKEQLSNYTDNTEVMVYDDHFENSESCDNISEYGYYKEKEEGKCFIHFWAL